MIILGLDPSLRNTGYFIGKVFPDGSVQPLFEEESVGVLSTAPLSKGAKKKAYKNEHLVKNAHSVYTRLCDLLDHWAELGYKPDLICSETPVGSQTASAAVSYGFCCALLGALSVNYPDIPIMHIRAEEVKDVWGKTKNHIPTKADIIRKATRMCPTAGWLTFRGDVTKSNEHPADALGAIIAGTKRPEITLAVNMIGNQSKELNQ